VNLARTSEGKAVLDWKKLTGHRRPETKELVNDEESVLALESRRMTKCLEDVGTAERIH